MRVRSIREFGVTVRTARERRGWSQQALADRAGVTREWVVRFEGGKPGVRLDRVFDVLTALDLSLELEPKNVDESEEDVL